MTNMTAFTSTNSKLLNKGFTLIEVMLAMAVFAIAGVALLAAAQNNFTNMGHLEQKMYASWVASNQLTQANLDPSWPPQKKSGKEELAGITWYWERKVIKTTDNNMRAIVVDVMLEEKDEQAVASLMTYVSKGTL